MISIGIDLVEISRFGTSIASEDFLQRCFCNSEIEYYRKSKKITYLAGRFAVKEAIVKALGTGLIHGLSFTDLEVIQLPSGAPSIVLRDRALELACTLGIKQWFVSISHTENYAIAIVIAD